MCAGRAGRFQNYETSVKISLEQHLSRMLALAIVVVGFLASVISFRLAYLEAEEFQDDTLRQIAALAGTGLLQRKDKIENSAEFADIDPEMMIKLVNLSASTPDRSLTATLSPGFHTVARPDGAWRVFVRQTSWGARIAIIQATEARDEIAIHGALRTLLPLLVLWPVLGWLAVRIVRRGFAPLRVLSRRLEAQAAEQPTNLPEIDLPPEIIPFVQAINKQMERIKRLMGQQQRFVADAAHELRTPLTVLSLQAQNLQLADNAADMRARIAALRAGVERTRRLAEQLLSFSRTQVASARLETFDLSSWVREMLEGFLPMAEAKGLSVRLDAAGPIMLRCEPEILVLVMRNALDNAVRYTPCGGSIILRLDLTDNDCLIEVIDSGPGVPIAQRERIFAPFYRIEGTSGDGSGLGLAIARDAATRLGGVVSVHDVGHGSGLIFRYRQPFRSRDL